jgi:hypothetical protein
MQKILYCHYFENLADFLSVIFQAIFLDSSYKGNLLIFLLLQEAINSETLYTIALCLSLVHPAGKGIVLHFPTQKYW